MDSILNKCGRISTVFRGVVEGDFYQKFELYLNLPEMHEYCSLGDVCRSHVCGYFCRLIAIQTEGHELKLLKKLYGRCWELVL